MPNWVKNIVKMPGIANLPLFSEVDGGKDFDFNKLIPMPVELDMESGSMTERFIVYFLTERCTNPIQDLDQMKAAIVAKLVTNVFSPNEWQERVFDMVREQMSSATDEERDKAYEAGRQYVSNYEKYGFPTWYEWRICNWGTKWNASDTIILNTDTIVFDTAWGNPEPVILKLAEMYPDAEIEHMWADENIGYNTGHRIIRNGEEQVEYFDGDQNAYEIYQECWGESDCVYLDENGILQSRDCDTCDGCK